MRIWLALLLTLTAFAAAAKDLIVVTTRPNMLHVIDAEARKVLHSHVIPGPGLPANIAVPKDGRVAYVLTNRTESVSGIELDTGKEVFRADMSEGDVRVKSMLAMTVSLDGQYLYVHQIPTRMKKNEYEVLDTRIAVYRTSDGVDARPVRTFAAPRRIALLAPGATSDRLIAMGWDIHVFDAARGAIDKTFPLLNWQRPGFGEPDILDFFPQFEQTRILSSPYYVPRTDVAPTSPEAMQMGMLTFDLDAETMTTQEIGNAELVFFSSVINPVDRNEAFMVMNNLFRVDLAAGAVTGRVPTRTHYSMNISSDGKEVYLAGGADVISVHDAATLRKTAEIQMPGGRDQGGTSIRIVHR